ncbi:MAG: error-prone DNA polymerase [Pseudomonadota bacterium]
MPSSSTPFAELVVTSNFTFLTGASHPEEMVARAAELGLEAIAIADRNTLAGVVRAHVAARDLNRRAEAAVREKPGVTNADVRARAQVSGQVVGPVSGPREKRDASDRTTVTASSPSTDQAPPWSGRFLTAARVVLEDSPVEWIALPTDRAAYGRLCRLLTVGKRRVEKGSCQLRRADLMDWAEGMVLIALPPDPFGADAQPDIRWVARRLPGAVFLAARPAYDGRDAERIAAYARLAAAAGAPMIATADVLMHRAARRRVADVLTCIREGVTVDQLGVRALPNAERRLKSGAEIAQLFAAYPDAVSRTVEIAARCRFSLDELKYEYPDEVAVDPETGDPVDPQTRLEQLAWDGLSQRYPDGVPDRVQAMCARELALIKKLDYARYFLTVRDVVAFAESQEILVQGRGSAANSVVCYALRITAIGPEIASMVFERFVSEARNEPPDIDVDFEHERREEVIQHIYAKYGRERAGLCATVIHFRHRAAIREVGKAMGLSQDALSAIASQIWGWGDNDVTEQRLREIGLDPADRRLRQTMRLVGEIIGFPRHLSQHVGGFVMTRGRLDELCPIENAAMEDRTVIEWDKDDIDALGILKVDVLSLGMLTCIRKAFDLIETHLGARYTLATLPPEDPAVYDMLCEGDSIGVFQVESRAQMNFLPRMKPRKFYDLVIEVAIVRPGPIQGDMVHPYLRRRQGKEEVTFPSGELEGVLGKTLGVPLFQEQAMQIAIVGAGFDPSEADRLRRALATFRKSGTIHTFRERFVDGMTARGYDQDFADRCFSQIEGFGEYGFPESHAASFALLVYASAWLKKHHPAVFACALLNSQPMGFYAPAQLVRDARAHDVEVRPVCVNESYWDNTLEPDGRGGLALRLGFRQVKGFGEDDAVWIASARGNGYQAVEDVWRRAGVRPAALEKLAEADAFRGLGLTRRDALWAAKGIKGSAPLPLFADLLEGEGIVEADPGLAPMTAGEEVVEDYLAVRLTLRQHPVALLRDVLTPCALRPALMDARPHPGPPPAGEGAPSSPHPEGRAGEAFTEPSGSAGAAYFNGAASLESTWRRDAARAHAEGRPPPPKPGSG